MVASTSKRDRLGDMEVTADAVEALLEMLAGAQISGHCIRLRTKNDAAYLAIDTAKDGDQGLLRRGEVILVADARTLKECAGYVLGYGRDQFRIWRASEAN